MKVSPTCLRFALTGTPVQNNLAEYYNMLSWLRPGCLGSAEDFDANYIKPIAEGSNRDSTPTEVRLMKVKTKVFHATVSKFMDHKGASLLAKDIPTPSINIVHVKMSSLQRQLLNGFDRTRKKFLRRKEEETGEKRGGGVLELQRAIQPLLNHPGTMFKNLTDDGPADKRPKPHEEGGRAASPSPNEGKIIGTLRIADSASSKDTATSAFHDAIEAARSLAELDFTLPEHGAKMELLLNIVALAVQQDEKVVIFSHSIPTLDFVEYLLGCADWGVMADAVTDETKFKCGGWTKSKQVSATYIAWSRAERITAQNGALAPARSLANCAFWARRC